MQPQQLCSSEILRIQNQILFDRNVPSSSLQPYLEVRPVATKYSYFPVVDPRIPSNQIATKQAIYPTYNVETTFNPGTRMAPWSGFATNVNLESELRNQIFALQRCSQSVYVPSSTSDMYNHTFPITTNLAAQYGYNVPEHKHPLLFQPFDGSISKPIPPAQSSELFNNATRIKQSL